VKRKAGLLLALLLLPLFMLVVLLLATWPAARR